jgi:hypothetical protein
MGRRHLVFQVEGDNDAHGRAMETTLWTSFLGGNNLKAALVKVLGCISGVYSLVSKVT